MGRSFLSKAVARTVARPSPPMPISYTGRGPNIPMNLPTGMESQMRAYSSVGILHAMVSRLSNATSQPEWRLYEKQTDPTAPRNEITDHPAIDVWRQPNRFYTRQEFIETGQQHIDLVGENIWVVSRLGASGPPLEMWPVRPDRMTPVPSTSRFIAGWLYRDPSGDNIPLDVSEVIQLKTPNPMDPYRGISPAQAIMADLDSHRLSAEWNRNFFLNSAEPGGIIEVDHALEDEEWRSMVMRWREQHQGVANSHRVAIVEEGKWVDRKYTIKDMQFPQLRGLSVEMIRMAYSFPKNMLGTVDDVNRANAETGEQVFARWLVVPRLERYKWALNADFLPMFGPKARNLEFDYTSPVPDDPEQQWQELTAKANAASILVTAGFNAEAVLDAVGLPPMDHTPTPRQAGGLGEKQPTDPDPNPKMDPPDITPSQVPEPSTAFVETLIRMSKNGDERRHIMNLLERVRPRVEIGS